MIQAHDLVCDVFQKYPEVFVVFEQHGMCEDCKHTPPPVSVSHFASKHCNGDIEGFLRKLNHYLAK